MPQALTGKTGRANSKRRHFTVIVLLVLLLTVCLSIAFTQGSAPEQETAWVCPMHPDYTMDIAGTCPRCGMNLVHSAPFDVRDYQLDFRSVPALVKPGQKTTLRFQIRHPGTGEVVRNFELVHERQYHLFLISQNMEYFQHIHPEEQTDGTWTIDVTLPKPGYYKVLSDFLPSGGASQFIAHPLVTAGYAGDLEADGAHLVPDTNLTKSVDDITATLSYDPPQFVVGLYGHLNFHLTDTATGRPITDLQTYLGAFGHTLIMSEDMVDYVHSHPLDILAMPDDDGGPPVFLIPPGADLEKLRGGPDVTFEGLMPKPGRYRAWTQFRRNGKIHTFAFTFTAVAP
jgi:rRNA maturation protein Nop10